jgi:hypothetical protein
MNVVPDLVEKSLGQTHLPEEANSQHPLRPGQHDIVNEEYDGCWPARGLRVIQSSTSTKGHNPTTRTGFLLLFSPAKATCISEHNAPETSKKLRRHTVQEQLGCQPEVSRRAVVGIGFPHLYHLCSLLATPLIHPSLQSCRTSTSAGSLTISPFMQRPQPSGQNKKSGN